MKQSDRVRRNEAKYNLIRWAHSPAFSPKLVDFHKRMAYGAHRWISLKGLHDSTYFVWMPPVIPVQETNDLSLA
jgi:hypothetical protein